MKYNIKIKNKTYNIHHIIIKGEGRYIIISANNGSYFDEIAEDKVFNYSKYVNENDNTFFGYPRELIEAIYNKKDDILKDRKEKEQKIKAKMEMYRVNLYKQPVSEKTLRGIFSFGGEKMVLEKIEEHRNMCISKGEKGEFDYTKILRELKII